MLGRMNIGRRFGAVGAGLAVSAALAACGGGGGSTPKAPSALDPANIVPASSVVYVSAAIRPQGAIKTDLTEAIDSVAGKGAASRLYAGFEKSAGKQWRELKSWAGQRIGFALTALPSSFGSAQSVDPDVLLVLPTNDPAAAKKFLAHNIHHSFESWKLVGHYAMFGGAKAVAAASATTAKTSLAAAPAFRSDMSELGSSELVTAYAPLHQLYAQLRPLLSKLPQYSGGNAGALNAGAKQAPPGSSVAFGMAALHNEFRMDIVEHGVPRRSAPASGVASDVSSLPASSWLAITIGGSLTKSGYVSKLASSVSSSLATIQAAPGITGRVPSGPLRFIVRDLLPALGPMELSVSGTSSNTLQAGLVMAPDNRSAGARLASAIKHLVAGLPVSASTTGGRVAVTYGFSDLQQLLKPSSTLSGNPVFKHALSQLPAGSKASLYLNFSGIATLAALVPNAGNATAMRILHRLDYLIAGGTHSHLRLVLATN